MKCRTCGKEMADDYPENIDMRKKRNYRIVGHTCVNPKCFRFMKKEKW